MKSYDEYFTKEKVKELKSKVVEFFNFQSEDNGSTNLLEKHRDCVQQAKELFIEEYLSKDPDLFLLWKAVENINMEAVTWIFMVKANITSEQYLDTLATNLLFNLDSCNFRKVEFILTKTELTQSNVFRAEALKILLPYYKELTQEGLSDEFLLSLIENNNCIHKLFSTDPFYLLRSGAPQKILNAALDTIPDLNAPIIETIQKNLNEPYDVQYSYLVLLLNYDRFTLAESLISKGAHFLLPEVVPLMRSNYIPDSFLIGSFKNMPNFKNLCTNGKMIINGQPLIREVIQNNRGDLLKYLVNNGIDVNVSWTEGDKTYTPFNFTRHTNLFEILVNSGRLVKTKELGEVVSEDMWKLQSDKCYDFIIWRNNFTDSVLKNCNSLSNWIKKDQVHFVNNLFKAFNKIPCISEIKYIAKDEVGAFTHLPEDIFVYIKENRHEICKGLNGSIYEALPLTPTRVLQDKYGNKIIEQNSSSLPGEIFAYFKENWHKSMLICKELNGAITSVFNIPALKGIMECFLMDAFKAGELQNLEQLDAAGLVEVIEDN